MPLNFLKMSLFTLALLATTVQSNYYRPRHDFNIYLTRYEADDCLIPMGEDMEHGHRSYNNWIQHDNKCHDFKSNFRSIRYMWTPTLFEDPDRRVEDPRAAGKYGKSRRKTEAAMCMLLEGRCSNTRGRNLRFAVLPEARLQILSGCVEGGPWCAFCLDFYGADFLQANEWGMIDRCLNLNMTMVRSMQIDCREAEIAQPAVT
jgi:hypothetical protein